MAGIVGLSTKKGKRRSFPQELFKAIFYQQHFSEEWAGVSVFRNRKGKLFTRTREGLFRPYFEKRIKQLRGIAGIGYCGAAREPLEIEINKGRIGICFSGCIRNRRKLKNWLMKRGVSFNCRTSRDLEIELIANLIAEGKDIIDGIRNMTEQIEGTYTLLILCREKIYAARSPDGHWCLTIGKKEGEVVIASSSAGFSNMGLGIEREVLPGEIISMKDGKWQSEAMLQKTKVQVCSFLPVYTDHPAGEFQGIPIALIRKRLGANLAKKDIAKEFIPDIVISVRDSGAFGGIGCHQEFCRQKNAGKIKKVPIYDEFLMKYGYAGRSFTPSKKLKRELEAKLKILISSERLQGKIVIVVVDDSIVRGTQMVADLIPKLRMLGIEIEIHLRITNPELRSHCPWGKSTKRGECLANKIPSLEKRIEFLGVKSLVYNTIEDLIAAIGLPREQLCIDCSLPQK
jgi:amidophosphoribosyltransferase